MKKLLKVILIIPICLLLLGFFFKNTDSSEDYRDSDVFSCLVAGFDEAAENTDVLFVFSYCNSKKEASIVQIPRDTYCNFEGSSGRINRIYALSKSLGHTSKESMKALQRSVEKYFGIHLDGYIGISMKTFVDFIDYVGGVYINIPNEFSFEGIPLDLRHGENLISGKEAEIFVRHRSSYANADLGRVDAQKIFLEGLFHTMFERLETRKLIGALGMKTSGSVAGISLPEAVGFVLKNFSELKTSKLALLTVPGAAIEHDGIWYYAVNKNSAQDAVSKYMFSNAQNFDEKFELLNNGSADFRELYYKKDLSYRVYSHGEIIYIKPE